MEQRAESKKQEGERVRRAEGENLNIGPIRPIGPIFCSEFTSERGRPGYPLAGRALLLEGATQTPV